MDFDATAHWRIDDVELVPSAHTGANEQGYASFMYSTLAAVQPGSCRFMDTAQDLAPSISVALKDKFGQQMQQWTMNGGWRSTVGIPFYDKLKLAAATGCDPYITLFTGTNAGEIQLLMNYLGGTTGTGAAIRIAQGQTTPWTTVFGTLHRITFQLGNEQWGNGFDGTSMIDPTAYGRWINYIFGVAKATPEWSAGHYAFMGDAADISPFQTQNTLDYAPNVDRWTVATYDCGRMSDVGGTNYDNFYKPCLSEATFQTGNLRYTSSAYTNNAGSGWTDGTYTVALTPSSTPAGSCTNGTIRITVSGGTVTAPNNANHAYPYGTAEIVTPGSCTALRNDPNQMNWTLAGAPGAGSGTGGTGASDLSGNTIWQQHETVIGHNTLKANGAGNIPPLGLGLYELGTATTQSGVAPAAMQTIMASEGRGLGSVNQVLKGMRDTGVLFTNYFTLAEYEDHVAGIDGQSNQNAPFWGAVLAMNGPAKRYRPSLIAVQTANQGILPTIPTMTVTGTPTYNQALSINQYGTGDNAAVNNVPLVEVYPFTDGTNNSVVVTNIDTTTAHTLTLAGAGAPTSGNCLTWVYNSTNINDTNEVSSVVPIPSATSGACPTAGVTSIPLPAHSLTVIKQTGGTAPSSTTTTLSASPSTIPTGTSTTLTAAIAVTGTHAATGTVTFYNGSTSLGTGTVASGSATLSTSALPVGADSVNAIYGGDAGNAGSTSNTITVVVTSTPAPTTTTLTVNPTSMDTNTGSTLTATITPSTATGTVNFMSGSTLLNSAAVAGGVASAGTGTLYAGTYNIVANYTGDTGNAASSSSPPITLTVTKTPTNSTVSAAPNSAVTGATVVLTASVTPGNPPGNFAVTGTVTFLDSGVSIGTGTLTGGGSDTASTATFSTTSLAVGSHTITISYPGDTVYQASTSSAITVTISPSVTATTTTLTTTDNTPPFGGSVTFTATLAPTSATGTVSFLDGATTIGSGTLSSGIATFTTSSLAVGTHSITAVYPGTTGYGNSTSAAVPETVSQSSTVISSSNATPAYGTSETFTATVTPSTATGIVTFVGDSTSNVLGTCTLAGGTCAFSLSNLIPGSHSVIAQYPGDGNSAGSNSSPTTVTVGARTLTSSSATLSAAPTSATFGAAVALTAGVTPPTATGTVTFKNGAATIGTSAFLPSAGAGVSGNLFGLTVGDTSLTPNMTYSTVRSWNNTPDISWAATNTANGVYNWTALDAWVASNPGKDLIYDLARTPNWASLYPTNTGSYNVGECAPPSSLTYWDAWLTAVATRYAASIKYWEVWNEPDLTGTYCGATTGSAGDIPTMVTMTAHATSIIKAIIPAAVILAPATTHWFNNGANTGTPWMNTFLADGGAFDVFAFHGYIINSGNAEDVTTIVSNLQSVMSTAGITKPLWDTEANARTNAIPVLTPSRQPGFLAKMYILHQSLGVARFSWYGYKWQMYNNSVGEGPYVTAYNETYRWLVGAIPSGPCSVASGVETCSYTRPGGYQAQAVWETNSTGSTYTYTYPAGMTEYRDVAGTVHALSGGTVTIGDAPILLENGSIPAYAAILSTTSLPVGSDSLTAVYNGDTYNATATSAPATTVTVSGMATSTALTATPSTVSFGGTVNLSATVTGATPTGSVTFYNGATSLGTSSLVSGTATLAVSTLPVGTSSLTAVYAGDSNNAGSTSPPASVTVTNIPTTTTATSSPTGGDSNQQFTVTATVAGSTPTGTVTFSQGSTTLGTSTISSGTASANIGTLTPGSNTITATYNGDSTHATSSGTVSITVTQATTTTNLTSSLNPSTPGASVTFTATVVYASGGYVPLGTVTFKDGSTTIGTVTLTTGLNGVATFSTTTLSTASHAITAVYSGNTLYSGSTSSVLTQVVQLPTSTTSLASSSTTPTYGSSITLTATVTGSSPTGTVTFKDGSTTLGTGTVSSGTATYSTSSLVAGGHSLTAVYGGDAGNSSSTSSILTVTVSKRSTSTALAASSSTIVIGQSVTFNAAVAPSSGTTGTVTFKDGSTTIGTGTISAGNASLSTAGLGAGVHSVTAVYGGDGNNLTSTSAISTVTVGVSTTVTYGNCKFNVTITPH